MEVDASQTIMMYSLFTHFIQDVILIYLVFGFGFCWTWAFFPGQRELSWLERCCLSIGLSFSLQPLFIFLLHFVTHTFIVDPGLYLAEALLSIIPLLIYAYRRR